MSNIIKGDFTPKQRPQLELGPYADKAKIVETAPDQPPTPVVPDSLVFDATGVNELTPLAPDQNKAIEHILSGASFIFVGIKPGERGMDYYTAMHGDPADHRMAQDDIPGVVARLYLRRGINIVKEP